MYFMPEAARFVKALVSCSGISLQTVLFLCITIALSAVTYIKAALRGLRPMFETGRNENIN